MDEKILNEVKELAGIEVNEMNTEVGSVERPIDKELSINRSLNNLKCIVNSYNDSKDELIISLINLTSKEKNITRYKAFKAFMRLIIAISDFSLIPKDNIR